MRFVKTVENLFGLPLGFTRVAFLESDSTAYVDTGVSGANNNLKIEMGFSYSKFTAYGYLFSNYESETANVTRFCLNGTDTNWGLAYINTKSQNGAIYTSNFTKDSFHTFVLTKTSVTIDGNTTTNNNPPSGTENTKNIILFNRGAGTYYEKRDVGMRCYYFRIYDSDVLVRDFIPCIDPLGVACMYDLVGKKPYYNLGTGTFTAGRQIIPVEYLEGTGTQYIDTGLDYFADFEVGIQLRANVSNKALGNGAFCCMQRYNATNPYWYFTKGSGTSNSYASSTRITEYHVMKWKDDKIYADDVLLTEFTKDLNTPNRMCLFGVSSANKYPNMIYFCKLWNPEDGTLVRDYIPCKDENDIGFMFDRLSGECYLNSGTGDFVFGENKYKTKLRFVKDNILPAGYTQIEYLESTGTQWIDTGIIQNLSTELEVNCSFTDLNTGRYGCALGGPRFYFGVISSRWIAGINSTSYNHNIGTADTQRHIFKINKDGFFIDGTNVYTSGGTNPTNQNIALFTCLSGNDYNTFMAKSRCYGVKIYNDGVLVRNFIPALDPLGMPCMYDLVSRTPFYNNGTGTFITGKPILPVVRFPVDPVPVGYKTVNYLESTGTQYIDTGYLANSNTKVDIGFTLSEHQNDVLFGGRTTAEVLSFFVWAEVKILNCCRYDYTLQGANNRNGGLVSLNTYSNIIKDKEKNYLNGTQYSSNTIHTFATTKNAYLFAGNNDGTADFFHKGKIYYAKLWDNGMLIRNFIPVVRRVDKVAGMWDTVTKQFYGNSGTGNFNYG